MSDEPNARATWPLVRFTPEQQRVIAHAMAPQTQRMIRQMSEVMAAHVRSPLWEAWEAAQIGPTVDFAAIYAQAYPQGAASLTRIAGPAVEQIARSLVGSPQWAELQASLAKSMSISVGTIPQLAATMERVRQTAALAVEMPTIEGFAHLADLLESGEIDPEVIEAADDEVTGRPELDAAIADASAVLAGFHPALSRDDARMLFIVFVYIMWAGTLLASTLAGLPTWVPAAIAASGVKHETVTRAVGDAFDRRYPPEECPPEEYERPKDG